MIRVNLVLKQCSGCKELKANHEFHLMRNSTSRRKLQNHCKDCTNAYLREWSKTHRAIFNKNSVTWRERDRRKALAHYGNKCACCGITTYEFLTFDHINGGGLQHRKAVGSNIARWLIKNNFPAGFQVLCHNCNCSKGFYGTCPHTKQAPLPFTFVA